MLHNVTEGTDLPYKAESLSDHVSQTQSLFFSCFIFNRAKHLSSMGTISGQVSKITCSSLNMLNSSTKDSHALQNEFGTGIRRSCFGDATKRGS